MKEWLSVKETSEIIGKHENTVYKMIEDGRLRARKNKEKYEIMYKDIKSYEHEKILKDDIKDIDSSIERVVSEIDSELLFNSRILFYAMDTKIEIIKDSEQSKKLRKVRKEISSIINEEMNSLEDKLPELEHIEDINKRLAYLYEQEESLSFELDIMMNKMILNLEKNLTDYFNLNKLKLGIENFKDVSTGFRKEHINYIKNKREGIF